MADALSAVKGTAYSLGDAATVAASMSASGISSGTQMQTVLKTVADTATISGESMTQVGAIFSSVAARGKLQGDDLLQLTSAGVPVLQFLSNQLHVSTADVSAMVTKGQIDFSTFAAAMQAGLGGAALSSGNTFQGAMANVQAALSRLGASFATPGLNALRLVFVALIPLIDTTTAALKPLVDAFTTRVTAAANSAAGALGSIKDKISSLGTINLSGMTGAFAGALPLIGAAGSALVPLTKNIPFIGDAL